MEDSRRRGRRILLVLAAIFLLPVVIAFAMYYSGVGRPAGSSSQGELIDPARPLEVRGLKNPDGTPTGRIDGTPSFREGKVARVEEWLATQGRGWTDFSRITVYSDSPNDLPLLERATEPVATNPSESLARIAQERGWRILNLFA